MNLPLAGLRVAEFAGLAPAPLAAMILADYGATVIRIDKASASAMDCLGRGKKSITVDLKNSKGLDIAKKICLNSDILIEPFRPGVMEKLGLGPSILCQENPKLIYARLTGYGQTGPMSKVAGHDINYLAMSGLLSMFGRLNSPPTPPCNFAADFAGGSMSCVMGILMALLQRANTGEGQVLDCSMVEGAAYVGSWLYRSQAMNFVWGKERGNNLLDTGYPLYDTYKTKDDQYMAVGALEPQFAQALLKALGDPFEPSELQTNPKNCKLELTAIFKTKTKQEWSDLLMQLDACVTPVLNLQEAPTHEHNRTRNSFVKTDNKKVPFIPAPAPKLSSNTANVNMHEVSAGENSKEILNELGIKANDIEKLIEEGVVQQCNKEAKL